MKTIAVINYKGGVGKTTLTANLAAWLAYKGRRVLAIDLDPQASLTFSFISPTEWAKDFQDEGTIKRWFDGFVEGDDDLHLSSLIQSPAEIRHHIGSRGKLDMIYSHLDLINVDLDLATMLPGVNPPQVQKKFLNVHNRLRKGLQGLAPDSYDVVLIDCPPSFNIVTKTAIVAGDFILVPTRPDELSTLGIDHMLRNLGALVDKFNDYAAAPERADIAEIDPKLLGLVFTMIQQMNRGPIGAQQQYITRHKTRYEREGGLPVFDSYIKRNDSALADAPSSGIPVIISNDSNSSMKTVIGSFRDVCEEFIERAVV